MEKKVFVSGCFDLLHSGHIHFLKKASKYGDLYVSIGSNKNIRYLKEREPANSEEERLTIIGAIRYVKEAFIARGMGELDFVEDLKRIRPDIFIVNEDGNTPAKRELVESLNIEYLVLKRELAEEQFTTDTKKFIKIPYRIDLAGGWLDQPFVSKHYPGSVITFPIFGLPHNRKKEDLSFEQVVEFNTRSGMASSTRKTAIDLWGHQISDSHHPHKLAQILFAHENPPGKTEISGAQDAIGIVVPGVTRSHYNGEYWPHQIETLEEEGIMNFLEDHISLIPLNPRQEGYKVLGRTDITPSKAQALAEAAEKVWKSLQDKNLDELGRAVRESFLSQVAMFPSMVDEDIRKFIKETREKYPDNVLGYKLSGAGGGGYLICITKEPLPESIGIKIMREIIRD
ncbi:MAG: adenylyltransferase/cytidyltransferase family protein [Candidatus Paceibacterota bacterium]|jgi:cytidyltransferase-like protein